MKTVMILIGLLTSASSFALNNEWVCHTQKMGPTQRQLTVNLNADNANNISAVVYVTSTVGRYEPRFFPSLVAYGLNGAVSYASRGIYNDFSLTINGQYKGVLSLGSATYPVVCSRAKAVIAY